MKKTLLYFDNWSGRIETEVKSLAGPILIVGASGFIGSKLFFNLSKRRDDVFGCSKNAKQSWRLSDVQPDKLFNLDITDFEQLKNFLSNLKPKTVFNLAAYGAYSRQTDAEKIHTTNYIGSLNLLRALYEIGCGAFVHAGTSSEYGLNADNPSEASQLVPNSDYAVSKVGASYLIKYYGKILNFPAVNLRLFSVYGPWEERDRLIPTLISSGLKKKFPNFVAKDIARDYIYIDDCLAAFVKAALYACRDYPGVSINIATGRETRMSEIAEVAKRIFKIKGKPVFGSMENRKWDLIHWRGNPKLAKQIIGWQARTSFTAGIQLTAKWEKIAASKIKHVYIPKKQKKISVVITCYRDNRSIPILHQRLTRTLKRSGYEYELIFVNDGSPTNDEEVIAKLSALDSRVIGISHSRNFGSQSAFVSGMGISSGDAVVIMDGDGQDPPELITDFIVKWEKGYDIVYGQRVKREAPIYMQFFYKLFYKIFRKLSDVNIPVDAGDFSLMDRKTVNHLLKFSEKDIFLRGLRAWIGFKQIGAPYKRPERLFGRSTNNFFRNLWWAKKGIFSFSVKPLHYIQSVGVLVFFVTLLLAMYYLILYFIVPPQNAKGATTIILLVLGIGSIQLISISVLGDYIAKIIEEVKNRPKFIRNKIIFNGKAYEGEGELSKIINQIQSKDF